MFFGNDATKLIKNFFNVPHSPIFPTKKAVNLSLYDKQTRQFDHLQSQKSPILPEYCTFWTIIQKKVVILR